MKKKISRSTGGRHKEKSFQAARKRAGLTQDQAAEQIGCEPRSLRRCEAGERLPRSAVVQKMMRVYDCEFAALIPDELISGGEGD